MSKNLKTGNKKPKSMDHKTQSERLVPLPKMYQMGVAKGKEAEQQRIIALLESDFKHFEDGLIADIIERIGK
jgi:hypothetical protein